LNKPQALIMDMVAQPNPPLQYSWLTQAVLVVAPALLGWELVTVKNGVVTSGIIVEVEAYGGAQDPASHAYKATSQRNAPMSLGGGFIYTYRSYGIHIGMNVVTGPGGDPQGVLIRALRPVIGQKDMIERRGTTDVKLLARGPGRLTQALNITQEDSGTPLGNKIMLRRPLEIIHPSQITASPRRGIQVATDLNWRFYLTGDPFVS
jgi:DNA-3-methyladenine glycosylase